MPRKNSKAGQPNRDAQATRRERHRAANLARKAVRGPGSPNLVAVPTRERVNA